MNIEHKLFYDLNIKMSRLRKFLLLRLCGVFQRSLQHFVLVYLTHVKKKKHRNIFYKMNKTLSIVSLNKALAHAHTQNVIPNKNDIVFSTTRIKALKAKINVD
jgi:hypothetical protein